MFSQGDEDGIIHEIFNRIGTANRRFLEIGAGDGLENNTAVYLPTSAQLLTGSFRTETQQGRLTFWTTGAAGATPARPVIPPARERTAPRAER